MSVNIVTANIKANPLMRQSFVESDIAKVKTLGSAIFWQEIAPDRYKSAVSKLLPGDRWSNQNLKVESPISLDNTVWEVLQSGVQRTHEGRAAVTPTRWVSWVVARRRGSNKIIAFVNSHFVSGAFNPKYKFTTQKWRRQMWDHHYDVMDKMVERFVSAGYTVIGGGDWNRGATPKFISTQRWLALGGIDHLFTVEAPQGVTVTLNHLDRVGGVHTDHDPRVANVSLHYPTHYIKPTTVPVFSDIQAISRNGVLISG